MDKNYEEMMLDWASYDARRIIRDGDTPGKRAEYRLGLITGFNVPYELKRELYEYYLSLLINVLKLCDGDSLRRKFTVPVGPKNRSQARWLTT